MAYLITIQVDKGITKDCEFCPFKAEGYDENSYLEYYCGKPDNFPSCGEVNYETLKIIKKED